MTGTKTPFAGKMLMVLAMGLACLLTGMVRLSASDIIQPSGKALFEVSGRIDRHNGDGIARIDRALLEKIGLRELSTRTTRSPNIHHYRGVLMRDLLDFVEAKGAELRINALDGYCITVPMEDYYKFDILLAIERDQEVLTIRTRGPARIIYPISDRPELLDRKYGSRHIWQIESMIVE